MTYTPLALSVGLAAFMLAAAPDPAFAAACDKMTLSFDARAGSWSITPADCGGYVDFDINGRPTVFIKDTVKVSIVITNINPLAYRAHFGEITLEPIDAAKDLQALLTSFGGLVRLVVPTTRSTELDSLKKAYDDLITALRALDGERDALVRAAQRLEADPSVEVTRPKTTVASLETLYIALREALDAAPKDVPKETVADVDKALATHAKAIKSAASMQLALAGLPAGTTAGSVRIENVITLTDIVRKSAWDKVATYPITIARTGLLADDIVTTMPKEIATRVKVAAPQALLLGVGVGIVTTNLSSKTWKAVADSSGQKVITQTEDARYAAVPALIGTYAFTQKNARRPTHPMLEFGASLDPGKPAWFVGGGVSVGRFLRLGVGGVLGRVNALDGQSPGMQVADNDAIKTTETWNKGFYVSFGLSFSSLNLFSKD